MRRLVLDTRRLDTRRLDIARVSDPNGTFLVWSLGDNDSQLRQPLTIELPLAVGDLEFLAIGDRFGDYAELTVFEKAAWELCDTERMIAAAKLLYGPFSWGRVPNPRLSVPLILAKIAFRI